MAAALPQASGGAAAGAAVEAQNNAARYRRESCKKEDALDGLERWKERHPEAAAFIEVEDVLLDAMRGRYTTWTRIRINLRNVPKDKRPAEEPPDPDYDPWDAEKMRSGS